jgi:hypothetical protein
MVHSGNVSTNQAKKNKMSNSKKAIYYGGNQPLKTSTFRAYPKSIAAMITLMADEEN